MSDHPESPKALAVTYLFNKEITIDPEKTKKNWDHFWA
jgi:hypothetical protein